MGGVEREFGMTHISSLGNRLDGVDIPNFWMGMGGGEPDGSQILDKTFQNCKS